MNRIDLKDLNVKSFVTGTQWIRGGRQVGEEDNVEYTDADCCLYHEETCKVICD